MALPLRPTLTFWPEFSNRIEIGGCDQTKQRQGRRRGTEEVGLAVEAAGRPVGTGFTSFATEKPKKHTSFSPAGDQKARGAVRAGGDLDVCKIPWAEGDEDWLLATDQRSPGMWGAAQRREKCVRDRDLTGQVQARGAGCSR